MSGSKFNSNAALNKTPGVCHSPRKEPPPPSDPPPPGTFPGAFYCNVEQNYDIGFGTEQVIGRDILVPRLGVSNVYRKDYLITATRMHRVIFIWDPIGFNFRMIAQTSDIPPTNFNTVQVVVNVGPDPLPLFLNGEKSLGWPNIPNAEFDVWP